MESFCQRLEELNPGLNISNDASDHDMYYLNNQDPDNFFGKITSDPRNTEILNAYRKKIFKTDRLVMSLVRRLPRATRPSTPDSGVSMPNDARA